MAWYYDNHGELMYVPNGDPRFIRDGIFYLDPAPVSFGTPPFYNNDVDGYRRSFRYQHPDFSRGREFIPVFREEVRIRREDPDPHPTTGPWWHNPDHPHNGGCTVWVEHEDRYHEDDDEEESTVLEFHAPELYSDRRQRRVEDALRQCPGVVNVVADQWQRKVVVVGNGLREDHVLRLLQRVRDMGRSVLWRNRRG